jgi:hypothetical protein
MGMVVLVDWTELIVFDKKKLVNSIKHTFYKELNEILDFKWIVIPEGERSRKVSFSIKPETRAFKYKKNIILKKNQNNVFRLKVDTKELPDNWNGELQINSEGVVRKIELTFEKTISSFHK